MACRCFQIGQGELAKKQFPCLIREYSIQDSSCSSDRRTSYPEDGIFIHVPAGIGRILGPFSH